MSSEPSEAVTIERTRARCSAAFRSAFGREPAFAAAAPGRVNLIGEHTDYNGGLVLPIAIDRACVAVGAPAVGAGRSRVVAVDVGEAVECDLSSALSPAPEIAGLVDGPRVRTGSWASYVLGVGATLASRVAALGGRVCNVDVAVSSAVPPGGGLSSSAALEVSVATALEHAWGVGFAPVETARLCREAEHEFAGVPCGIMDQFISAMGREGHALLIDCRSESAEEVPMPPAERAVVVVMNTNVHHALASGEYARRRQECRGAAAKIGVSELRDATLAQVRARAGDLCEVELKRTRHVVTENGRVLNAAAALRAGDLASIGRLMNESHESLRLDYEVSCEELDVLVELARGVRGVFGARMTGGGFGGCAIALAEPAAVADLSVIASDGYRAAFGRECDIFATRACAGARLLSTV